MELESVDFLGQDCKPRCVDLQWRYRSRLDTGSSWKVVAANPIRIGNNTTGSLVAHAQCLKPVKLTLTDHISWCHFDSS